MIRERRPVLGKKPCVMLVKGLDTMVVQDTNHNMSISDVDVQGWSVEGLNSRIEEAAENGSNGGVAEYDVKIGSLLVSTVQTGSKTQKGLGEIVTIEDEGLDMLLMLF